MIGFRLSIKLVIFGALIGLFLMSIPVVFAQSASDIDKQLQEKQQQIDELQKQINDSKQQANTLSSQLNFIDAQTKLTELKKEQTEYQIKKLDAEIEELGNRITRLSTSVDQLSEVLLERITRTYKYSETSPIELIFSASSFSDALSRLKYLQVVQENDKRVLYQLQATKTTYDDQRNDKQSRQVEQEALQVELAKYQTQLDNQKTEKDKLLNAVKNDQTRYQNRLSELQREINQIQNAAKLLISTEPRQVKKGDLIGLMGNSGYSTGAHLHFAVYNISSLSQYNYYSNYEDPTSVLRSTDIKWWDYPSCGGGSVQVRSTGSGSFDWPMDTGSLYISQGYGDTCFTGRLYGGRPHPALDMYNNSSISVRAVEDGQAYFCRNCQKDGGNGVFLFHSNGKMTLYWHLQ